MWEWLIFFMVMNLGIVLIIFAYIAFIFLCLFLYFLWILIKFFIKLYYYLKYGYKFERTEKAIGGIFYACGLVVSFFIVWVLFDPRKIFIYIIPPYYIIMLLFLTFPESFNTNYVIYYNIFMGIIMIYWVLLSAYRKSMNLLETFAYFLESLFFKKKKKKKKQKRIKKWKKPKHFKKSNKPHDSE